MPEEEEDKTLSVNLYNSHCLSKGLLGMELSVKSSAWDRMGIALGDARVLGYKAINPLALVHRQRIL